MENKTIMWVIIGVLLIAVVFLTYKVTNADTDGTGKLDTAGWTQNEIMNYEMHGTIPARVKSGSAGSAPASSGMVGGC